jgi:hypothetical protein
MQERCFTLQGLRSAINLSRGARTFALAIILMAAASRSLAQDQDVVAQEPEQPAATQEADEVHVIGATTVVTEVTTGVPLPARVDTGATSCSIHCESMEIEDANPDPRQNIGKPIRFLVKYGDREGKWVESKIVDHVVVRTSERDDERYKVKLQLRWQDVEKKVVATLNDRQKMKYPMLLGRNFLRDDFLVNVSKDAPE